MEMVSAVVLETVGTLVAADTPLMSAGLDSIAATELATTLAQRVDAELPQTLLFDHPTTGAVASFVAAIAPAVEQCEARGESEPLAEVATWALEARSAPVPTHGVAL